MKHLLLFIKSFLLFFGLENSFGQNTSLLPPDFILEPSPVNEMKHPNYNLDTLFCHYAGFNRLDAIWKTFTDRINVALFRIEFSRAI
jgi:hypothetical protein